MNSELSHYFCIKKKNILIETQTIHNIRGITVDGYYVANNVETRYRNVQS